MVLPPFPVAMADDANDVDQELLDYEEEPEEVKDQQNGAEQKQVAKKEVKGTYVSIHSSGFRDFLLKPELLRSIVDCGFEHPSEGETPSWPLPGGYLLVGSAEALPVLCREGKPPVLP